MNNVETYWYNKSIFNYISINSKTTLNVILTSNTQDFQNFSPLTLDLNISSKDSKLKFYKLNYLNSYDLLQTIIRVRNSENPFRNKYEFSKRYNRNKNLEIKFTLDSNEEEIVEIIIRHNDLDFNDIVIPKIAFNCLCNLIKDFNVNYIKISTKVLNNFLQIEHLKELKINNNLLKSLPSQLIEINQDKYESKNLENNSNLSISNKDNSKGISQLSSSDLSDLNKDNLKGISQLDSNSLLSSKNLDDFDSFIGGNEIKNIEVNEVNQLSKDIPKENTPQEVNVDFKSDFINNILDKNIMNFENLMLSIYQDSDPLQDLLFKLRDNMNIKQEFHFLADISLEDFKSIKYLSNVLLKTSLRNYLENNADFPDTSPIIKFRSSNYIIENKKLAYDLLLIIVYIKIINSKLSPKVHDAFENKKILYVISRLILDPLVFSFLNDDESAINEIMLRFKSYKDEGFFKEFDDLLTYNNCKQIEFNMVKSVVEKIISVNKESKYIQELHDDNYNAGKLKIPSENELSIEQITNEIVELEVSCKLDSDKKIDDIIKDKDLKIPKEILSIIKNSKQPKRQSKDYGTNLARYMNFNKSEIQDKYKDDLLNYVNTIGFNNFDYDNFPLEELNEIIIKGIYIWNESENKEEKYTKFYSECENTISKDMIISKIRTTKDLSKDDVPWFE